MSASSGRESGCFQDAIPSARLRHQIECLHDSAALMQGREQLMGQLLFRLAAEELMGQGVHQLGVVVVGDQVGEPGRNQV